jgi:hypothetical protein
MKNVMLVAAVLLMSAGAASAATTQKWTAGWDNFGEPLNYKKSKISWSVNPRKGTLSVTFKLVGATPSKLYEVAINFFCTTFPPTFGQFPVVGTVGGTCQPVTRQGVTAALAGVALGVVTTDLHGNGSFALVVGPIAAGTYVLEFAALDGAGCDLIGGAGQGSDCALDFQSPGPIFGDTTTITIP